MDGPGPTKIRKGYTDDPFQGRAQELNQGLNMQA